MGDLERTLGPESAYLLGGERGVHPTLESCSSVGEQEQGRSFVVLVHKPKGKGK
jgi:hypothetical protein